MSSTYLWYATRATGIAALVLLSATTVLGILVAGRARSRLPGFARVEVHRRLSITTAVFLVVHVVTSLVDTYVHIGWAAAVVPASSDYERLWVALGAVALDLCLAVAVSSALRRFIPARLWRSLHWLAYLSWPVAVSHALGMGTDMRLDWVLALVAACVASVVAAATWRAVTAGRATAALPFTVTAARRALRPRAHGATAR
jgi:methionine sulfoxide reductase heme-binding subunit